MNGKGFFVSQAIRVAKLCQKVFDLMQVDLQKKEEKNPTKNQNEYVTVRQSFVKGLFNRS